MLTGAWIDCVNLRDLSDFDLNDSGQINSNVQGVRRLATALEMHAILAPSATRETVQACAFVAAESLSVIAEFSLSEDSDLPWIFGDQANYSTIETGLLYLIAGYDSNAALAAQSVRASESDNIEQWCLEKVVALLRLYALDNNRPAPTAPRTGGLTSLVRYKLFHRIGAAVERHVQWLNFVDDSPSTAYGDLQSLIADLEESSTGLSGVARHADIHHLALLILAAIGETTLRALRSVQPPDGDGGRFEMFQRSRARRRPLLWPAAHAYSEQALPGPHSHAVVTVPTGAGKSSVADLAISHAVRSGWVLYLAPTNALVAQIRRELSKSFSAVDGVAVKEFIGGAEYTELAGEELTFVEGRQILVMTPEKCSLALRQDPEIFSSLALCVFDEAHMIGASDARAVVAELVISEILHRAPQTRVLMLSALLANPEELASWLSDATGHPSIVVNHPWRPTRTLRAVAGFDQSRAIPYENEARSNLNSLPARRKKLQYDAPLSLLAGLQGSWSSKDFRDYRLVGTSITGPLTFDRTKQRTIDDAYCNRTVARIAQALGNKDRQRVLVFLSRSRHDSFKVALEMPGFAAPEEPDTDVEALLHLSELELGTSSAVRTALYKGIGVHTGAMLREEQRASEISFETDRARVLFATGTLAQGLNLPATAVIIGGTQIGWDANASTQENEQRAQAQLLNAIGRAGRANVACRSLAIIVPNRAINFRQQDVNHALSRARFLAQEDASTEVSSQLDGLISGALNESLELGTMSRAEQTAFAFLSFSGDQSHATGVISSSWAAHRAHAAARAAEVAQALEFVGTRFLADSSTPSWIALAAHKAGLPLPEVTALAGELRTVLETENHPVTVEDWANCMLSILSRLDPAQVARLIDIDSYSSTLMKGISSPDESIRGSAWEAFAETLSAWLRGSSLIAVAEVALGTPVSGRSGRGQSDPLPKILKITNTSFAFDLATIAGALGAVVAAGREVEESDLWNLQQHSTMRSLNLLPLAIRLGAGTPEVIAWMRAGARPRHVAHLLESIAPIASPWRDDEELRNSARKLLRKDGELLLELIDASPHIETIERFIAARKVS
ncbi:DEAD/DEAH box helicase [Streptomyces sp. NRRL B-24484]|uniref:DEAD/DEAH box helicase n=1 Tax=Streptomyces sp. NRRL B-24484 TaxID=1463833 RepID=UPI00099857F4|nr:DEAD/DEAH box helicase [Streptomyces sp. NRRL B-24484]